MEEDRKYVIARKEPFYLLGVRMPFSKTNYVRGFMAPSDRVKGWNEGGAEDKVHEPRIRKTYTENVLEATRFDKNSADFICGVFGLVFRNNPRYSFSVKAIKSSKK